ncbi:MAG TPA: hypothetical protein DCG57_12660 [Candidatus Riflebacteria bacterium]|jgi:hypothetical protein|nr:hypothetical protein [Candidatus Riflebacteria bacterium]
MAVSNRFSHSLMNLIHCHIQAHSNAARPEEATRLIAEASELSHNNELLYCHPVNGKIYQHQHFFGSKKYM